MKKKLPKSKTKFCNDLKYKYQRTYLVQKFCIINYFEENNLYLPSSYKEARHKYNIHKVFDKWFFDGKEDFNLNLLIEDLTNIRKSLEFCYKITNENDFRTGLETYGFENIYADFCHINDRWNCQFRLRWILDVLDLNYKFTKIVKDDEDWVIESAKG